MCVQHECGHRWDCVKCSMCTVHFADLTFTVQPPSPLRHSDTFMNLIPLMIYRGMWLGCDLIFHRESAEALEALKCGGDRDGVVGCGG